MIHLTDEELVNIYEIEEKFGYIRVPCADSGFRKAVEQIGFIADKEHSESDKMMIVYKREK